jgi:hypothetical protein
MRVGALGGGKHMDKTADVPRTTRAQHRAAHKQKVADLGRLWIAYEAAGFPSKLAYEAASIAYSLGARVTP